MLSLYTLAALATVALASADDAWKSSAAASATLSFAVTIPADSSADDWYPPTTSAATSYTSTVYTTTTYTVTSCATTVTSCPVGHVTTETITSTTVICPATSTTSYPPPPPPPATTYATTPAPVTTGKVYPTTSALATSYVPPVYSASASANATVPAVKPSGTVPTKPSAFTGAANMVGGSLSLVAVVAFAVAAL